MMTIEGNLAAYDNVVLEGYDNVVLEGIGAYDNVVLEGLPAGTGGTLLAGTLSALLGAVIMGAAFSSYKKHGDSPVRGGVTYGVGALIATAVGVGIIAATRKETP